MGENRVLAFTSDDQEVDAVAFLLLCSTFGIRVAWLVANAAEEKWFSDKIVSTFHQLLSPVETSGFETFRATIEHHISHVQIRHSESIRHFKILEQKSQQVQVNIRISSSWNVKVDQV